MEIYLAPLQGLSDWIFRESFAQHIGKFNKTFSPFIRVQSGDFYRPSQCNDILPQNNTFQKPVPQFLGNDADSFKRFEELCLSHNYQEVNINLGCPFPMVTGKKMGAGLLMYPEIVKDLFENIFSTTQLKISIKCRLGLEKITEFEQLISIFNSFPLEEIILHPRVGKQQYKGEVDLKAFAHYAPLLTHPVCYNGDILTLADVESIRTLVPQVDRIMIGRGMLQNPFLLAEIRNQNLTKKDKEKMLLNFHLSIIEHCKQKYSGDLHMLKRLEELWTYHAQGFEDGHKILKQVKKSKTLAQYQTVIFKAIMDS
ncbi:MAG: tRNA-dihydrouridine synthase family protein [Paludibacter sp.]|nr:tRNA-dihydrouridine synthase family protein [Paludibacter sp.]